MIVRVFVPCTFDPAEGLAFSQSDHNFPVLPSIGQVLRFTDEREGDDFTVAKVGFVQVGDAFIAAVWVEGVETKPVERIDEADDQEERYQYRDLNYDVAPESMTGY